ncbi:putative quinol monooxygenase [Methanosarcina sp. Mfa9]|uniref:putative quinol monooxygenase n=1 Tax=Methanosarcina sp. Mfa9 TaxID=3439063 RepID=UPI003F83C206
MTVKVVAKNRVKPEKIEEFTDLCKTLVEESLKEEGCIEYGLYQELEEPGLLTMIEEWKDEKSLEEHFNSVHFKKIVPLISKCLEKEAEVNAYEKKL